MRLTRMGVDAEAIAKRLGCSRPSIYKIRSRYEEEQRIGVSKNQEGGVVGGKTESEGDSAVP